MGCNCKNTKKFDDEHGIPQDETLFEKGTKLVVMVILFVIAVIIAVIATPLIVLIALYQIFFGKKRGIMVPNKLLEAIKKIDF